MRTESFLTLHYTFVLVQALFGDSCYIITPTLHLFLIVYEMFFLVHRFFQNFQSNTFVLVLIFLLSNDVLFPLKMLQLSFYFIQIL